MYGLIRAGGDGKDVLLRMENELTDRGGVVATLQLLDAIARVSTENLDDVATLGGRSNQCALRIAGYRSQLDVVGLNPESDAFVCDEVQQLQGADLLPRKANDLGGRLLSGGDGTQSQWILTRLKLLDKFKSDEVKDECSFLQAADYDFLA